MKAIRFVLSVPRGLATAGSIGLERTDLPAKADTEGVMLWADKDVPLIEIGEKGYIIGILFFQRSGERLLSLPDEAPINSGAEALAAWLARECWGGYVAILVCPATDAINVIVDPSGLCPVYRVQTAKHILIATHPALFAIVGGVGVSASWPELYAFLSRPELRQRETCLADVTELAPGELVSVTGQQKIRRLWRPEDFMPDREAIGYDEAAEGLRDVAQMVCGAWAKLSGPVAVAASGGVDSSLICAALAATDAPFSCATVATSDASGDERRFVQLLAEHLGVRSIAAIYDLGVINPLRAVSTGLPRPSRKPFMTALDAALFAAAAEVGAQAIFDGNGGDNLFCFLHSSAPVVDRLRCEGPGRGVLSTYRDMCLVTGCDMPTMARAVARRLMRRGAAPSWPADLRLLSQALEFPDRMSPLTPWLHLSVGPHGGKRDHLALIMRAQLHIHGLGAGGLPRFSPLASQPLLEYCLGVPTWFWCRGGTNRALARAAFATDLPREIVRRTSKAGPDSFIHQSFYRHRESLRELLMDGLLARHGVIDRDAVANAFRSGTRLDGEIILRLLDLAEAENWARSWDD